MTKLLFIAATQREVLPLIAAFGGRHPIVVAGIGAAEMAINTIRAIEQYEPDMVVNVGIAGAIDRSISICDVVAVASDYQADHGAWRAEERKFVSFTPTVYECEVEFEGVRSVTARTVAMACSPLISDDRQVETMEGAAFFAAARSAGVRMAQIRSISNYVGDPRAEWRVDEAVERLKNVLVELF